MFAGAAAGFAAIGVGSFLKSSVSEASDLQQNIGALDAIFGKTSKVMQAFGKTAATSVGLSMTESASAAALLGAQLKNGGTPVDQLAGKTQKLIKMGADFAAVFGGSASDAVDAISSALKGERDPIERYGISLTQAKIDAEASALGFKKVGATFDSTAQQAATLSLIQKQGADSAGQWKAQTGTLAEQQQIFSKNLDNVKATIGSALLPVATKFFGFLNDTAIPATKGLIDGFKNGTGVGGRFGSVAARIGDYFQANILPAIQQIVPWLRDNLVPAFQQFSSFITGSLVPALQQLGAYFVANILPVLQQIGQIIVNNVLPIFSSLAGFFYGTLLPALLKIYGAVVQNLKPVFEQLVATFQAQLLPTLQKLIARFQEWQPTIQKVISVVTQIIGKVLEFAAAVLGRVLPVAIRFAGWLIATLVPAVLNVIGVIARLIGKAIEIGGAFVGAITGVAKFVAGVTAKITKVVSKIAEIPGKAIAALGDLGGTLLGAGKQLIQGFIDGIGQMFGKVKGKLGELTGKLTSWKGPPATDKVILRTAGQMVINGFVDGMESKYRNVKGSLNRLTSTLGTSLTSALSTALKKAGKKTKDTLRSLLSSVRDAIGGVRDSVVSAFSGDLFSADSATGFLSSLVDGNAMVAKLKAAFTTLSGVGWSPEALSALFSSGNGALILDLAANQPTAKQAAQQYQAYTSGLSALGTAVGQNQYNPQIDTTNKKLDALIKAVGAVGIDVSDALNGVAATAAKKKASKKGKNK